MNHSAVPSTSLKKGDYFLAANIHQGCDAKRYLCDARTSEHFTISLLRLKNLLKQLEIFSAQIVSDGSEQGPHRTFCAYQ